MHWILQVTEQILMLQMEWVLFAPNSGPRPFLCETIDQSLRG